MLPCLAAQVTLNVLELLREALTIRSLVSSACVLLAPATAVLALASNTFLSHDGGTACPPPCT